MARPSPLLLLAAGSVPAGLIGQFLLAGLALFHGPPGWGAHAILGFTILLPIGAVAIASSAAAARAARGPAVTTAALYLVQVALIVVATDADSGLLRALHAANGALLLLASFATALVLLHLRRARPAA